MSPEFIHVSQKSHLTIKVLLTISDAYFVQEIDGFLDTFMQSVPEDLEQLVEDFDILLETVDVIVVNVDEIGEDLEDLEVNRAGGVPKQLDGLLDHLDALAVLVLRELYLYHFDAALRFKEGYLVLHARFLVAIYFSIGVEHVGRGKQGTLVETITVEGVEDFLVQVWIETVHVDFVAVDEDVL